MSSSGINFEKLVEESGSVVEKLNKIPVHSTISSSATLTKGQLTPVNAESGEVVATLPEPKETGLLIAVEKTDSSANIVKISGTIRGESTSNTLKLKREIILFESESETSWRPIADHRTLSSLDVRYASAVNLRAIDFETFPGSKIIDFVSLRTAMEEQNKGSILPNYTCEAKEPNVLCNLQNVSAPVSKFQYKFYSGGPRCVIKYSLSESQAIFRFNQTAEGVAFNESLYNHPDVVFQGITGESAGSGTFATAYNRTFYLENVQLKNIKNGFINKGFSDLTFINGLTGDHTVTSWLWQGENGDGQKIQNIQAYGGKGIFSKHGSGTVSGLVSGEHKFVVSKWIITDEHLEGDGPNESGGKAQNPTIILEGGDYQINGCRLYTLTNPNRAAVEINDSGATERFTLVTFQNTRFMQRLDDPANPSGRVEPIGNLQGNAINVVAMSQKSVIKFIDTHAEVFQQTSEASQFDTRSLIGMKIVAPGGEAPQVALQEQFTNRRVMISSTDCTIRFNASTESPEIRPIGSNTDLVTTRKFPTPALNVSKFASGSEEAKAAPTTRAATTHYYVVWAIDDRGRKTNLSAEKSVTIASGEVPVISIITAQPCRVLLEHGTSAGTFTEWVEIILPLGQAVFADMGSAIGGQAWSSSGLPTRPTTATSENNTAAGFVMLDTNGHAVSFVTEIFKTGEWQKEGDLLYFNGIPGRCITSASSNNGGIWILLPANINVLNEGESTISRGECTTTAVTMSTKVLRLGFFTALKTQIIKHIRVTCNAAYVGVPTLIQLVSYSINPSTGELTLIKKTANNTSLLATAGEGYEPEFESSWEKIAGERYALGILVVTTGTAPTIGGQSNSLASSELAKIPRLSAAQSSTESLPGSIAAGSLSASSAIPYIAVAP